MDVVIVHVTHSVLMKFLVGDQEIDFRYPRWDGKALKLRWERDMEDVY